MEFTNIRIFNEKIELIKEISDFRTLIFISRWEDIGEFEIHLNYPLMDVFRNGYYVMVNNDPYLSGIIEYIFNNGDAYTPNAARDFTIKGHSLLSLINRHITIPPKGGDGYRHWTNKPVEDIMTDIITEQCINPSETHRKVEHLEAMESRHRGKSLTFETRHKNCTEELNTLSIQSELGVAVKLDAERKKFVFEVLEGIDRRYSAKNQNSFIFSKKLGRVKTQTFEHSTLGTANVAYVLGEGDGDARRCVIVGDDITGLERREIYVDARDISNESDEEGYNAEESLKSRGTEKLSELQETVSFEFEADGKEYQQMWNLGDKCTFRADAEKVTQENIIVEVTQTWEDGRYSVEPKAGHSRSTILSAIKSAAGNAVVERTGISARFESIEADYATIDDLVSKKVDTVVLDAYIARVDKAIINKADINMANIDDASIKSAKIDSVSADKLTAGTIDAKDITVKNLSAENITVGKINGKQIDNSTISKDNLDDLVNKEIDDANQNANDALSGVDHINAQKMIRVTVESTNGILFKNNLINTTLTCRVFSWDKEITEDLPASVFTWIRVSNNTENDEYWNNEHGKGKKTVVITSEDFYERAVYTCSVEIPE